MAGFGVYGGIQAKHILGGEISYTHISGNKYKFTAHIYRNCNECEFNTLNCLDIKNLDIYVSPEELGFAKKLGTIPISKVSKKDVTPLCKSASSVCTGGSFSHGIEELIYEGTYNFDTIIDYCKLEIGLRVDSRLDAYNQSISEAYYNFTRINICNYINNNSPQFLSPTFYILPLNQSFTYNILARDSDGDSLSYKFSKAQKGWNSNCTYPSVYSAAKPIDVNCSSSCDLNKNTWPIDGIGIESNSGWMGFTPITQSQTGFVVVEVTEWRKINGNWAVVGVSRRDMQVIVVDLNNNPPKITTSAFEYFACSETDFSLDFGILDAIYSGLKDSVSFSVFSDLPGGNQAKVGNSKNQFDALYTVPITRNLIRSNPYYLTIVATDNHCPVVASTYKTISIKVTGVPDPVSQVSFKECNKVEFKTQASGSEYKHFWHLFSGNSLLESKHGGNGYFEVPNPGKYYIRHQVENTNTGCRTETVDSIDVPYFSLMTTGFSWPDNVCQNEDFILKKNFNGGTAEFYYWWNGILGTDSFKININKPTVFELSVKDKNGCRYQYSKEIKIFTPVTLSPNDTAMCLPASGKAVSLNNRISITPVTILNQYKFEYLGSNGNVTTSNGKYYFAPASSGDHLFNFFYTDGNLCHYDASFTIKVVDIVQTGIQSPASACSNENKLDINQITSCTLKDGIWKSNTAPAAVSDGYFDPKKSGAGTFDLVFEKDLNGCLLHDTTEIVIHKAPGVFIVKPMDSVFCSTQNNFTLGAIPVGGVWQNDVNAPMPNMVSPSDLASKSLNRATYIYTYTDKINGCKSTDKVTLYVNPAVEYSLLPGYEMCANSQLQIDPKITNSSGIQMSGYHPDLVVKRVDDAYVFYSSNVKQKVLASYVFTIKGYEACPDKTANVDISIKPIPEIEIEAKPAQGCVPFYSILSAENKNPNVKPSRYYWKEGADWNEGSLFKAIVLNTEGVYAYEVKASAEGCFSEIARISVEAFQTPVARFETEPKNRTVSADFTQLTFSDISSSKVPYVRYWNFERGSPATSDKQRVSVDFPKDTGLYGVKLLLVTDQGCQASDFKNIRVRPGLQFFVPNAFTPDSKGPYQNEMFQVVMDSASMFHLTIRNRWGQLMFSSISQFSGWDGTYLNEKAPAGVYVWEVEANTIYGNYVKKSGTVSLLR